MPLKTHPASSEDRRSIEALCRRSRRVLRSPWDWSDYLNADSFFLLKQAGQVEGVFFAWADASPIAWVRLAALADDLSIERWLDQVLPPVVDRLRQRGVRELACMDYVGWLGPHLADRGFRHLVDVVEMAKADQRSPERSSPDVQLRHATQQDAETIATLDRAAFTPHWWHSVDYIRDRLSEAALVVVAELDGQIVGYALTEFDLPTAHLGRITVHPDHQRRGIGSVLLRHSLQVAWLCCAERVTLNTQADNRPAQQLYRRFGFEPTGVRMRAWRLELEPTTQPGLGSGDGDD